MQWREREVVVKRGEVAIYRRTLGTLKIRINLWDPKVNIVFIANESTFTVTHHQEDVIFDCNTPTVRDEWLGVIYNAQSDPPPTASLQASKPIRQTSDNESDTDSDFEGYQDETETLQAFQNVRSSIIFDVGQLTRDEINQVLLPTTQSLDAIANKQPSSKHAVTLANFIERNENGGKIILLHWDVLMSLQIGLSLSGLILLLAERQGPRSASHRKPSLTHKSNVANFIRDLLFHPLYSQRLRTDETACMAAIDANFSHCKLRRFSNTDDDLPSTFKSTTSPQILPASQIPSLVRKHSVPQSASSTASQIVDWSAIDHKKRHSFPSIVMSGISLARITPSNSNSFACIMPLRSVLATYKLSPLAFAQQCALFHHSQLMSLPLWSFLAPSHHQKEISDSFNRLTSYFVWSVVVEESPSERAEVIESITSIAMASSAKYVNNFHLVMACIGCLGDTPLMPSRLPMTWKKVKAKTKAKLYELRSLCDYTGGFDTLRRKQSLLSVSCPSLPFLGIVGASLERLKSTPYFTNGDVDQSLDTDRLERQYNALRVVENAMMAGCAHVPHLDLQHLFATLPQQLHFLSSKMLHLRSLQLLAYESSSNQQRPTSSSSSLPPSSGVNSSTTSATTSTAYVQHRRVSITTENARVWPYKTTCVLWNCVPNARDRLKMLVEALVADEKSTVFRLATNLHRDVKMYLCSTSCASMCLSISQNLDAIYRAMIDIYGSEIIEVTGIEDDWHSILYECMVDCVYGPMAQTVQSKLQAEYKEKDSEIRRRIQSQSSTTLVHYTMFNPLNQLAFTGQTPIAMLRLLDAVSQELNESIGKKQFRELIATSTTMTPQSAIEFISSTIDLTKCPRNLVKGFELFKKCIQSDGIQ